MKKSLLALAVLGTFAGVASAQSSVTLFGTIDLNARYIKNDGSTRRLSLSQDGINSSQLGFRGVEDLGGGLKASFILLAGVNADTGTTNSKFFNRRATVSLSGGFGEIRLGRDYVPTFWNDTNFDPFGTNGIAQSFAVKGLFTAGNTYIRADNSIGYFLPSNLGGAYGQLMAAAGEGGATNPGRYIGGRFGFAAGPFDIAVSAAQQRFIAGAFQDPILAPNAALGNTSNQKTYNVGGSYDFGVVKLMAHIDRDTQDNNKETWGELGAVVPMGQGEIHVSYNRSKATTNTFSNTNNMYALGYVYNISKRTAVYGTVARLSDGDHSNSTLAGPSAGFAGSSITALPTISGKSTGAEVGVRHFF